MRMASRQLGQRGERRAAWFYRIRGYRIVARNVHLRGGEIDLVARRGRTLVFVEVKARQFHAAHFGHLHQDKLLRQIGVTDETSELLAKAPFVGSVQAVKKP